MGAVASQIISLTVVYSTVCSGADQSKHQSSGVIGLWAGNSPVTGEFSAQMASNAENVSIWWHRHAKYCCHYTERYDNGESSKSILMQQLPWHRQNCLRLQYATSTEKMIVTTVPTSWSLVTPPHDVIITWAPIQYKDVVFFFSIGNPILEIRRSYDRLISTMSFPILVRRHLYIEPGPWNTTIGNKVDFIMTLDLQCLSTSIRVEMRRQDPRKLVNDCVGGIKTRRLYPEK